MKPARRSFLCGGVCCETFSTNFTGRQDFLRRGSRNFPGYRRRLCFHYAAFEGLDAAAVAGLARFGGLGENKANIG